MVIAIISIIAGFLVPTILAAREKANQAYCLNNLRQIASQAIIYADTGKRRFFPLAKGSNPSACESLNVLVRELFELRPETFVCRSSRDEEAEIDSEGRFVLEPHTCSYTWTGQKLAPTDANRFLASDKSVRTKDQLSGHPGGMNVVSTDTSAEWMPVEELDPDTGLPEGLVP